MSIFQVVGQLKLKARFQPEGVLRPHPQGQRQRVRLGELHLKLLLQQEVGVGLNHLQGHVAVGPAEEGGQLQGEIVLPQKLHQPPAPHLLAEGLADLRRPLFGDALDLGQLLRLLLDDGEGVLSELLDDQPGGGLAHPLHRPGGQIVVDLLQPLGQAALHHLCLHLGAVGGVPGPAAPDRQILPRRHPRHGAHHRHLLVVDVQLEDGVAVLLVLENNGGDCTLQQFQLLVRHGRHLLSPYVIVVRGRGSAPYVRAM